MATKIRNGSPNPITLPYPMRGILPPGRGVVLNIDKRVAIAALQDTNPSGSAAGGVADFGGLEVTEVAMPATAAFDEFYGGDVSGASLITAAFANWWIDPVNGDDRNAGTSARAPLKTSSRRRALWGSTPQIAPGVKATVNYLNSNSNADPESYRVSIGEGGGLTLLGVLSQSKVGTFTAVTTANSGTNTPWSVADTTAVLGAGDLNKLIRITGGARAGAYAFAMKDLGSGVVQTSEFGTFNGIGNTVAAVWTSVTPQVGDAYEVVTPVSLVTSTCYFERLGTSNQAVGPSNVVIIDSIQLSGVGASDIFSNIATYVVRGGMRTQRVFATDYFFAVGGEITNVAWAASGRTVIPAPGNANNFPAIMVGVGNNAAFGAFSVLRSGAVYAAAGNTMRGTGVFVDGLLIADDLAIFDNPGAVPGALLMNPGAICRARTASRGVWGANNTAWGVQCISGGMMTYRTKPNINVGLGAGREANVGGTDKLWSAIPYVEPANNAMIVVEAP